tara:strand:- start:540 stop:1046 length:507 start_codon:yes stop_codon:yes gene_type:complete
MAKKRKINYKSYNEDGHRYMICQNSVEGGRWWKGNLCNEWSKVNIDTIATLCHKCVNRVTEPPIFTPRYIPTGRPKGWQWMSEFVDKDGSVYHKGVEQPELKGTLPVYKVKTVKGKKRLTKREREAQRRKDAASLYSLKKKLIKAKLKKDQKPLEVQIRKLTRKIKVK